MDTPPMFSLSNISKTYGRQRLRIKALHNLSMSMAAGEVVGILGPNGSGKSTLVRIIAGLCIPDRGSIRWLTEGKRPPNLGVLLEGCPNVMERLSTIENAQYYCALRGCHFNLSRFNELALSLGLSDANCPVRKLSTGNKLRSALVTALIHTPRLVLLDEPTTGLDAVGVRQLTQLIHLTAQRGIGFLICSHDLEFIDSVCQYIVCLKQGAAIFNGEKKDFHRIHFNYRVEMPTPGQPTSYLVRSHSDLCEFLSLHKNTIASSERLEVKKLTLRDKYEELMAR